MFWAWNHQLGQKLGSSYLPALLPNQKVKGRVRGGGRAV